MKPNHLCGTVAMLCIGVLAVVPNLCAQEATTGKHIGFTQDWSQRQIVFSKDGLAKHPEVMNREPRVLQQAMQRWQEPDWGAFHPENSLGISPPNKPHFHPDWNEPTLGGRLRENAFPAKYSFDPGAPPDCTNDYVVFGLDVPGVTTGQANLIAYNNLYSGVAPTGICGTAPTVLFAYNVTTVTGGKILTSPVLSLDGTQIAFVESVPGSPGSAIFHVLTWTAGEGAIGAAAPPSSSTTSMTSVTFSPTAYDTASAPWIDYTGDIAYVGADNGSVYQITGAFTASPTLSGPPNWPAILSPGYHLTPPVLDSIQGLLMVGSVNGNLYQINTSTGLVATVTVGASGDKGSAILAPPIVDVTNDTTFVVTANNGTSAVLEQVQTSDVSNVLAAGNIGMGSTGTPGTNLKIYQPAFSNAYFTDPSSGVVTVCGTGAADTTPWQYLFGFSGTAKMITPSLSSQQLLVSIAAECTGWTEFYNPNAVIAYDITATSVTSNVLTVIADERDLTVGESVTIQGTAESFLNGQSVIITTLIGSAPVYTGFTANFTTPDYSNPSDTGTVSSSTPGTDFFFVGLTSDCDGGGTAGGCVAEILADSPGLFNTANIIGGPSGIVVDNYSTAAQASSLYVTALSQNTAYKFTQDGLN